MQSILENYWFLIFISSIPLIYWYFTRNFNYWSKRGINGPKPKPGVGTLLDQFITPRPTVEIAWLKQYGKIYGVYHGNDPALVVAEPELIKDILVKDFNVFTNRQDNRQLHPILSKHLANSIGEDWKRIRSIVSPTFTSGKMKKMYPMIKDCLAEFLDSLDDHTKKGKSDINVKDAYGNYTVDVIATCAFATKTNAYKDPNNPFIQNSLKVFNPKLYRLIPTIILPKSFLKAIHLYSAQDESVNEFFFDLTRHVIKERKSGNKKINDFIQLVLNEEKDSYKREEVVIRDVNDVNESHHVNEGEEELKLEKKLFNGMSNRYITHDEILAQAWIFFVAGYETTATTLTFASYELALNQDIQQRLYEEVLSAVDANGDIDYDLLSKLQYLDSVISETLRLHCPALSLTRKASEDYKLGATGVKLYKGQIVFIPIFAMHHSEEFYEEPLKFNPDRFMPENRHKIIPYTYLPFGGGPRNCIGMRFALMEAKVGLAQVIRRFRLSRSAETDVPLKLKINTSLHSAKRVIVAIEKRF